MAAALSRLDSSPRQELCLPACLAQAWPWACLGQGPREVKADVSQRVSQSMASSEAYILRSAIWWSMLPQLCHKAGWTARAAGVAECDSCPLRPETFVFVSFWLLAVTGASCSQSVYISLVHRNTQLRSAQAGAELDEWILECRQRVSVLISGHAIATDLVSCASGRHRCRKREKTHC